MYTVLIIRLPVVVYLTFVHEKGKIVYIVNSNHARQQYKERIRCRVYFYRARTYTNIAIKKKKKKRG